MPSLLRTLLPTVLVLVTIFASMGVVGPALALIQDDLGLSIFLTGALTSVFAVGRLAAGLPAGLWAERIGERRLMASGALAFLLGSALAAWSPAATVPLAGGIAWSPAAAVLLAGRLVQGLGSAAVAAASLAYILHVVPREQSGQAMAYYNGSIQLGIAFGPAVGGYLANSFGWRMIFVFSAAAAAGTILIALVSFGRGPSRRAEAPGAAGPGLTLGRALVPMLLVGVLPNVVIFCDRAGLNQFTLPLYLARDLGLDANGTALVLTFLVLVGLVLLPFSGRAVDRFGARPSMLLCLPVVALGTALFPLWPSLTGAYAASLVFSAGMAIFGPASGAYLFSLPGIPRNRAVGIYRFTTDLSQIVSPLALAALVDAAGMGAQFFVVAGINLLLLLPLLTIQPARLAPATPARRAD